MMLKSEVARKRKGKTTGKNKKKTLQSFLFCGIPDR